MHFNKRRLFLIAFFLVFIILPINNYAHSGDKIKRIEIEVNIKEDGSADIKENWHVNSFNRYGYTRRINNIEKEKIIYKSVTDEEQNVYNYIEDFTSSEENQDVLRDKFGILTNNDEVYLFWGVNKSGIHEYTINYEIKEFVKKYPKIDKGVCLDFIDNNTKCPIYLKVKSDSYLFNNENVKLNGIEVADDKRINERGEIELDLNSEFIFENDIIKLDNNSPFNSYEIVKKETLKEKIKYQDILVGTIIFITATLYVVVDLYRNYYEYKERKKKLCTWQTH